MWVIYFTVLACHIKNYYVFCKFNPDLKCYFKQSLLHQTSFINSWSIYYINNRMVYGHSTYIVDNLNTPITWIWIPALIWNQQVWLFTKIKTYIKYCLHLFPPVKVILPGGNCTLECNKHVPTCGTFYSFMGNELNYLQVRRPYEISKSK